MASLVLQVAPLWTIGRDDPTPGHCAIVELVAPFGGEAEMRETGCGHAVDHAMKSNTLGAHAAKGVAPVDR